MPLCYYNEIDPFAAAWLRNLIAAGHIANGVVDERDIRDVRPSDLAGFVQCHFFAGIGVWSYALRRAGWPDSRPVWTGSCPCQPFSAAGRGGGFADERHLWPHWHHLIRERRPSVVFGEQVASKDGLAWLDVVQADMEGTDYTIGSIDSCSAGHGAPHIRQRLRFVAVMADAERERRERRERRGTGETSHRAQSFDSVGGLRSTRVVADSHDARSQGRDRMPERVDQCFAGPLSVVGGMADRECERHADIQRNRLDEFHRNGIIRGSRIGSECSGSVSARPSPTNGFWSNPDWLYCRDGKWRPVEPGTFPLAHGATSRVGRLRAYGNAVDAEATADFIAACRDTVAVLTA